MNRLAAPLLAGLTLLFPAAATQANEAAIAPAVWHSITWNGEAALVSVHGSWKAIVSLERGRLVDFGPAAGETNLLFATSTRNLPAGWGGHRVWLGPQATWESIWPPPAAWEHSGPESWTVEAGTLRLQMPEAGDGWPRLTRTYRWQGRQLVCGAELTGGTRAAQVIQIVQVPRTNRVRVTARPEAAFPAGYVRLPAGSVHRLTADFSPPPQVSRDQDVLWLHYMGVVEKLGFRPQTLTARAADGSTLLVRRGEQNGATAGDPDRGFFTQVYLGGSDPFIELEQLSPLFRPGPSARFEIAIEGSDQAGRD